MWSSRCQPCMLRKFAVQRIIKKEEKGKSYGSFFFIEQMKQTTGGGKDMIKKK